MDAEIESIRASLRAVERRVEALRGAARCDDDLHQAADELDRISDNLAAAEGHLLLVQELIREQRR